MNKNYVLIYGESRCFLGNQIEVNEFIEKELSEDYSINDLKCFELGKSVKLKTELLLI